MHKLAANMDALAQLEKQLNEAKAKDQLSLDETQAVNDLLEKLHAQRDICMGQVLNVEKRQKELDNASKQLSSIESTLDDIQQRLTQLTKADCRPLAEVVKQQPEIEQLGAKALQCRDVLRELAHKPHALEAVERVEKATERASNLVDEADSLNRVYMTEINDESERQQRLLSLQQKLDRVDDLSRGDVDSADSQLSIIADSIEREARQEIEAPRIYVDYGAMPDFNRQVHALQERIIATREAQSGRDEFEVRKILRNFI